MSDLLLELFSEEIPARMQTRAAEQLRDLLKEALAAEGIAWSEAEAFATPRRLALVAHGLPPKQQDRPVERKGPRVGAPEAAIEGFLRSLGDVDYRLEERDERKGQAVYAIYTAMGRATAEILAEIMPALLAKFPWPKSMRWGEGEARWVRPLHGIICLHDGAIVPFEFAGIKTGRITRGHRFMAPDAIEIPDHDGYQPQLEAAYVMLDGDRRRNLIAKHATELAQNQGLRLRDDPGLLHELEGLAEWPVPLMGRIDRQFMTLPTEVLVISMRSHQKYLAVETVEGELAPWFVTVANIEAADSGAAVIAGNERVLRARLWDAKFFWDQDLATPLEDRLPKLETIVFHAELGTLREKVERIEQLAAVIANAVDADAKHAARAARLAKSDLVTGMVGEFPELQGLMGSYYARAHGETEDVAKAIADHYSPQGPNDGCPSAPIAVAVALADKIDTLAGFFAAAIAPTGSSDPFALRRAALGVIRLILENGVRLDLRNLLLHAVNGYADRFDEMRPDYIQGNLWLFVLDRLKVQQRENGVRHDIINAVGDDEKGDLVGIVARVRALQRMIETADGANLLAGYRRAESIVTQSPELKGQDFDSESYDKSLFTQEEEHELASQLEEINADIRNAVEAEAFEEAVRGAARIRVPIDRFFENVMVNVEDDKVRLNRLRLLASIPTELAPLADFSVIEHL